MQPVIPMVDLRPLHEELRPEINRAIAEVVDRGDFVGGEAITLFEREAADYLGVEHAIGLASGTDALTLALRAAGVGRGDEVITSPFSFWATVEAIHSVGARAVYVDIAAGDMNLDPALIEAAISPKTRAILPVHIFGQCLNTPAVMEIARAHGLVVIEDAAQAFGARWRGQAAGSFGTAGCFSFYPSKPLGCLGDGGMVVTNDGELAQRVRLLANHGTAGQNRHSLFGGLSRLDTIQAAVLRVKLAHLDHHLSERRRVADNYRSLLADFPLELPIVAAEAEHCFAQFTIRCDDRDALQQHLAAAGVASAVHYPLPLYRQKPNRLAYAGLHLPEVETCSARCLSLPMYQGLTPEQQLYIGQCIGDFFQPLEDAGSSGR